jgi:rhodanese-related sulfurtransferase
MSDATVSASELRDLLQGPEEVAVLDLRNEGRFAEEHLLLAASLPFGRLELDMPWRVPRQDTRIVLVDDEPERAARAAHLLKQAGYRAVSLLRGFPADCAAAGMGLFSGKHVPSKAFGEVVETALHTPRIGTATLQDWKQQGRKLLMVDSRTTHEFTQFALPGALSCPGAELVARVPAALEGVAAVVVNCAGRTRSIIGAQSLLNLGLGVPVHALENGTMAWHLDGHRLVHDGQAVLPAPGPFAPLQAPRSAALALLRRTGGRLIGWAALQAMLQDPQRTTYFYDVRQQEAFQHSTLPGARQAAGGELVQATDHFAPVRNARLVLMDTEHLQAPMTAHWLRQMGWEADVLDLAGRPPLARPAQDAHTLVPPTPVPAIAPLALQTALRQGRADAIDCASSIDYRRAHIPGAWWCPRPATRQALARWEAHPHRTLVFTAADPALARFAAADAAQAGLQAAVLAGGTPAWRDAGLPMEAGAPRMLGPADDIWYSPYEVPVELREQAMHDYIRWEIGLTERIRREPGIRFQVLHAGQSLSPSSATA